MHLVAVVQWRRERVHLLAIHEQTHVRAHAVLLVDHPEADARVAAVEVGEQLGERRAVRLDVRLLLRVGTQRLRNPDLQVANSAVSTEWIIGR